jgi:hypothetical protein
MLPDPAPVLPDPEPMVPDPAPVVPEPVSPDPYVAPAASPPVVLVVVAPLASEPAGVLLPAPCPPWPPPWQPMNPIALLTITATIARFMASSLFDGVDW